MQRVQVVAIHLGEQQQLRQLREQGGEEQALGRRQPQTQQLQVGLRSRLQRQPGRRLCPGRSNRRLYCHHHCLMQPLLLLLLLHPLLLL